MIFDLIKNFLNRQKKPKYFSHEKDGEIYFTIKEKVYDGVVVTFQHIQILEDTGFAKLKFNYTLVRCDNFTEEDLQNDSKFVTIIGDILQHYILYKAKQVETTRSSNTKEFGL